MIATEQLGEFDHIIITLPHLPPVDGDHIIMYPITHRCRVIADGALGDLAFMMREQKIHSAPMNIKLANSRTILSKLKKGFSYRSIQANLARQIVNDSPHPVLFCGDLNDVPNSYTYFKVRGSMQDAFLKKGFGVGRTFAALSPTLRIDYIFADKNFKINQFNRVVRKLSDHYMLVADVTLKTTKN